MMMKIRSPRIFNCPGCNVRIGKKHNLDCPFKLCGTCGNKWPCEGDPSSENHSDLPWLGNELIQFSSLLKDYADNSEMFRKSLEKINQDIKHGFEALISTKSILSSLDTIYEAIENLRIGYEDLSKKLRNIEEFIWKEEFSW